MKKVGHQVNFTAVNDENPRNGEGTFIRLNNGDILFAYSRFSGKSCDDHDPSDIAGFISTDEGETWSEPKILLKHDDQSMNYMCPSFIRLSNGDVGLIYLRKFSKNNAVHSTVQIVRSADEGETWSEPVDVTDSDTYYVIENEHAVRLTNGRILMPTNPRGVTMRMFASDDDGYTWTALSDIYHLPHPGHYSQGIQETVVYQEESGRIRAFSRSELLCQYECYSDDNGETWHDFFPNTFFASPLSPMMIKRVGELTIAVWNPLANIVTREIVQGTMGRTPLVLAVSKNDGKEFTNPMDSSVIYGHQKYTDKIYYIEDDPKNGYCYPAIFDGGDYILVCYYHSNDTKWALTCNKIVKINLSELD